VEFVAVRPPSSLVLPRTASAICAAKKVVLAEIKEAEEKKK
jgi:hypothetical protein